MSENDITGESQGTTPPVVEQGTQDQGQVQQPEKTVPLAALEDERRKRQQYEREAEIYRKKAEILEQGTQQPSVPEYDPEDVPTYRDMERILKEREAQLRQENRQTQIALMVQEAKRKYADYDKSYELAMKLVENNPDAANVIMASANPAEAIYNYGKTHPEFVTHNQSQAVKEVVDQINANANAPRTLSDVGGGGQPPIEKDWKKASSAEINAELDRLRRAPR